MVFLDFEKPLEKLYEQLEKIKQVEEEGTVDMSETIKELEKKITKEKKEIYANLTGWQRVQLSRHPERPYTLYYIEQICKNFIELHGDRYFGDDPSIVGGFATIDRIKVLVLGHEKGKDIKEKIFRNFGSSQPEGYRKAIRLMQLAQKFNMPIVTLVDTMGAFPGKEAEERGQAEAIARSLYEMSGFTVIQTLKKDPSTAKIPIIVNSSMTGTNNKREAEVLGASGFVDKTKSHNIIPLIIDVMNQH